jgi:hypothetical protein
MERRENVGITACDISGDGLLACYTESNGNIKIVDLESLELRNTIENGKQSAIC